MYNVKLYRNTGFNAINIPDSPSRLPEQTAYTCAALDIYQARELSQFSIRIAPGRYTDIQDADYLYLQNSEVASDFAYYSIQNITMTSNDVAVLSVTMDYILSAGGVNNLEFLDGMCERHHVTASEDEEFGAFDEPDPYLTPAEMLQIEPCYPEFWEQGVDPRDNVTILESTLQLEEMSNYVNDKLAGCDYESLGGNICTVPTPPTINFDFNARMYFDANNYKTTIMPKVGFYLTSSNVSGQTIDWLYGDPQSAVPSEKIGALSRIRSLSMESAIIAQYAIPKFMISDIENSFFVDGKGVFNHLNGKYSKVQTDLPFYHSYNRVIRNNRIYYGDNCKYHIVSIASGNEATFLPEEIYDYDAQDTPTAPNIVMRVDPRPKGCPYFRFEVYRNNKDENLFFINCVKGLEWQNVPLIYEGGSGSLINQYKFDAHQAIARENAEYTKNSIALTKEQSEMNTTASMIGNIAGGISALASGRFGDVVENAADFTLSMMNQDYANKQYELSAQHAQASYNLARHSEMGSLLLQNNVVAPSINFPIAEGIRDFVGNTCLVYRTFYSDNDVARLDKILTMYGYRHTTPIQNSFLTNRVKFNYIQARGVSVGNKNLPKWMRDGIAIQFESGVRIWHQLPDPSCYTNGSNVSTT